MDAAFAPAQAADGVTQATRALALFGLIGLVVLGLAWELWLAPTGSGTLAIKVLPLLPALAGVWRHRMYTYRWLSLLVWVYCAEGLVRATSDSGLSALLALLQVLLCVAVFVACALHVRIRLRSAGKDAIAADTARHAAAIGAARDPDPLPPSGT